MKKILLSTLLLCGSAMAQSQAAIDLSRGFKLSDGNGTLPLAVSTTGTARVRYNLSLNRLEQSLNGAAYAAIGSGGGSTVGLEGAYAGAGSSTDNVLLLTSTFGAVKIRDNATPLATLLFSVESAAGASTFFKVDNNASQIAVGLDVLPTADNARNLGNTTGPLRFTNVAALNVLSGNSQLTLKSAQADGASVVNAATDTVNAFSTTGAIIHSFRTNAVEKLAVKKLAADWALDFVGTGFLRSGIADGASAVANILDTSAAFSTTGASLLDVRTNAVAKVQFKKLAADWAWDFAGSSILRSGVTMAGSGVGNILDTVNAATAGDKILSIRTAAGEKAWFGNVAGALVFTTAATGILSPAGTGKLFCDDSTGCQMLYNAGSFTIASSAVTIASNAANGATAKGIDVATNAAFSTAGAAVARFISTANTAVYVNMYSSQANNGCVLARDVIADTAGITAQKVACWTAATGKAADCGGTNNLTTIAGVTIVGAASGSAGKVCVLGPVMVNADAGITVGQLVGTSSAVAGNVQSGTVPGAGAILGRAMEGTAGTTAGKVIIDLIKG